MLYRYCKGKAFNKAAQESFNQCSADNRIPAKLVLVERAGSFGGSWIDSKGVQLLVTHSTGGEYSSSYQAPGGPPMGYNIVIRTTHPLQWPPPRYAGPHPGYAPAQAYAGGQPVYNSQPRAQHPQAYVAAPPAYSSQPHAQHPHASSRGHAALNEAYENFDQPEFGNLNLTAAEKKPAKKKSAKKKSAKKKSTKNGSTSYTITQADIGERCIVEGYDCKGTVKFVGRRMDDHESTRKVRIGVELKNLSESTTAQAKGTLTSTRHPRQACWSCRTKSALSAAAKSRRHPPELDGNLRRRTTKRRRQTMQRRRQTTKRRRRTK